MMASKSSQPESQQVMVLPRCSVQGCCRPMASYDTHEECLACLPSSHDMVSCDICRSFPEPLKRERARALKFKREKSSARADWQDYFFSVFKSLDAPSDSESDTEQGEHQMPTMEEGQELVKTPEFQAVLEKFRAEKSSTSLSLHGFSSSLKGTAPKRAWTEEQDHSTPKKKARTDEGPHLDPDSDIEILHVEVPEALSPIRDPPRRRVPQPKSKEASRLDKLESLILDLTREVRQMKDQPQGQPRDQPESNTSQDDSQALGQAAARFSVKEKRQLWLESLRETNPELAHPSSGQSQGPPSSHFGVFLPATTQPVMPFCPLLRQEIEKLSQVQKPGVTQKDHFAKVDKYYPTMEPMESTVLQPRSIPSQLLDEVPVAKLQNPGATGATARLASSSGAGQKEEAALKVLKQSSTFLRLVNSQELAVEALRSLNVSLGEGLDSLQQIPDLPIEARRIIETLQANSTSSALGLNDVKLANSHMAKCSIIQYSTALRARQSAWVNSSNLSSSAQGELVKSDLAFPVGNSTEPLHILGPRGVKVIDDIVNKRQQDVYRDFYSQQKKASEAKANRGKKKFAFKPQAQTQPQFTNWFPQTQSQPPQRGRGGGRGRGRGRGRGKASQPFSQGKPSPNTQ